MSASDSSEVMDRTRDRFELPYSPTITTVLYSVSANWTEEIINMNTVAEVKDDADDSEADNTAEEVKDDTKVLEADNTEEEAKEDTDDLKADNTEEVKDDIDILDCNGIILKIWKPITLQRSQG